MSREYEKVSDFGELSSVLKALKLEVPRVNSDLLKDPSKLQEGVSAILAGIGQIKKNLTDALSWQEKIAQWLDAIENDEERRIAQDAVTENQTEVQNFVDDCLTLEEIHFRRTAAVVYLKNLFSREIQSCEEATLLIRDLEEKDIISRDEKGPIRLGYSRYSVSDSYGFKDEEVRELSATVESFSRKLVHLIYEKREETKQSFEDQATITLKEMEEGKEGICLLEIPAESYVKDGKELWYSGGSLLAELVATKAGNKYVRPCQIDGEVPATGGIAPQIEEMVRMRTSLAHYTLEWEMPPGAGKSFARIKEAVERQQGLSPEEAEKYVRKMQMLWYLIKRTIKASKEKEAMDLLKEELGKKADITPEEFYGLNGTNEPKEGSVLLAFKGAFKNKRGNSHAPEVYNLFLLMRQERIDQQFLVSVLDAPDHVKDFLGQECFTEKYSVENNFREVCEPLGRILRGIKKQVDMACQLKG